MAKTYSLALAVFFLALSPALAHASTISIAPATGSFTAGESVTARIIVTGTVPVNAATVTVTFPASIFSIESTSKADSILNFWVTEPTFSKGTGTVEFEGVALGGFNGTSGTLLTVRLRAIKAGTGEASFQVGQVFANDGQGTDITSGLLGASYLVQPAPVTPPASKPAPSVEPTPEAVPEPVQPLPSLQAPAIMLGEKYGAPAIVGSSQYPKADVLVTFVAQDGAKVFISSTSDESGSFTLLVPTSLRRGTYTVTAVMVLPDKTNSTPSNSIVVAIGSIWSDLGPKGIGAIIVGLMVMGFLAWKAFHVVRRGSSASTKAANIAVRKSFLGLRKDLLEYEEKAKPMPRLEKDIDNAERTISREIDDIK